MLASLQSMWNSPIGPRTVFFWAPMIKWGLVAAGISDLTKPPEKISSSQSLSLAVTGFLWARYSTQIIPWNWNLFAVNFFVGCTGLYQLIRKYRHEQSQSLDSSLDSSSSDPSAHGGGGVGGK